MWVASGTESAPCAVQKRSRFETFSTTALTSSFTNFPCMARRCLYTICNLLFQALYTGEWNVDPDYDAEVQNLVQAFGVACGDAAQKDWHTALQQHSGNVLLQPADGSWQVSCHDMVLLARSEFFATLLLGSLADSGARDAEGRVIVALDEGASIDLQTVSKVVEAMYTDSLGLCDCTLEEGFKVRLRRCATLHNPPNPPQSTKFSTIHQTLHKPRNPPQSTKRFTSHQTLHNPPTHQTLHNPPNSPQPTKPSTTHPLQPTKPSTTFRSPPGVPILLRLQLDCGSA